jgi:uncharacterized surface protein with fasciclin (FAS1) repeats
MKKLPVLVAACALAATALAGPAAARDSVTGDSIAKIASTNDDFSTLVSLVKAAGLVSALDAGNASLTVFAPTNAAFTALERAVPGVTAALTDPKNTSLLQRVLKYHILGAEVKSPAAIQAAKAKAKVQTIAGKGPNARIALNLRGGKLVLRDSARLNAATVVLPDVDASNGVIHAIDEVIVPKGVASALVKAGLIS